MGFDGIKGLDLIDEATRESLIEACQSNGWVKIGGFPWQDDPYLEEYPYEFTEARNADALAGFFAHGNWAIRQGVVYGDLAFVQQVDGGDEWWIMKRDGSSWQGFESGAFRNSASSDRQSFERIVASMRAAELKDCKRLEYRLGEHAAGTAAAILSEADAAGIALNHSDLVSKTAERIASSPKTTEAVIAEAQERGASEASKKLAASIVCEEPARRSELLVSRARDSREAAKALADSRAGRLQPALQAR